MCISNFEGRNLSRLSQRYVTTRSVCVCGFFVVSSCCFLFGRLLFQQRSRTQSCRRAAAGIPNVHTETFGTKKRNRTEFRRPKIRNTVPFRLRFGFFCTILHSRNCLKTNIRNVPATCASPTKHDEFIKMYTRVSWPADGAAFPGAAVMPKADSYFHPI